MAGSDRRDYITPFLRDAVRINASPWMVANVMRFWIANEVPTAQLCEALDAVESQDPALVSLYRLAVDHLDDPSVCDGCFGTQACWACLGTGRDGRHDARTSCRHCSGTGRCRRCDPQRSPSVIVLDDVVDARAGDTGRTAPQHPSP